MGQSHSVRTANEEEEVGVTEGGGVIQRLRGWRAFRAARAARKAARKESKER